MPSSLQSKLLFYAAEEFISKDKFYSKFVELIIEAQRVDLVPKLCTAYAQVLDEKRNILRVKLRTAAPVEQDFVDQIKNLLLKKWKAKINLKIGRAHV